MKKRDVAIAAPALGASLLPSLSCPACWPAYASLLSALGLSFLGQSRYLLWLNVAALLAGLIVLLRRAGGSGYLPVSMGALAAVLIVSGKFFLNSNLMNWLGAAALLVAFVWSGTKPKPASCPRCAGNPTPEVMNNGVKES